MLKDIVLRKTLIHLGIIALADITVDPNISKIDSIYYDELSMAINALQSKVTKRYITIKEMQLLTDKSLSDGIEDLYILPSDFLSFSFASGTVYKGKYFQPNKFYSLSRREIEYYAMTHDNLLSSEFTEYLSLKLAISVANIFNKTDNFIESLRKDLNNAYQALKSTENYLKIVNTYL